MGRGRDHGGRGKGRGGGKNRPREEEESDDDDEPEDKNVGGQSGNVGMMPPSDSESEDDDDDGEEEEEDDDPPPTSKEMAEFIKGKGLADEFLKWLKKKRQEKEVRQPSASLPLHPFAVAPAAPQEKGSKPMPGYEMSRKEREAAKKRQEEEEESEDEPDPEVIARLEIVRKRREAQAAARIAKDGWDRMKPMAEDNHPPGTTWPLPE